MFKRVTLFHKTTWVVKRLIAIAYCDTLSYSLLRYAFMTYGQMLHCSLHIDHFNRFNTG
jgi:hypothetical protein